MPGMSKPMVLFDDFIRTEDRAKRESEPLFEYYNILAGSGGAALRSLLQGWFDRLPEPARMTLGPRFRNADDISFQSAFFELYLHELARCMGYEVEHEPNIHDTSSHPDFLVKRGGEPKFYLEATLAAPSAKEQANEKRAAVVYNTLDQMTSPNFFLHIRVEGAPTTPPAGARLRADLEEWLATLDPDEVAKAFEDSGLDGLPVREWAHDDWKLTFVPVPRSPEHRGKPGVRPLGSRTWSGWNQSQRGIRKAVVSKAAKYGNPQHPLVIAVNVLDESAHESDVMEALFGDECLRSYVGTDGRPIGEVVSDQKANGAWRGPSGPQHRCVSAVLIAYHLDPWRIAEPPVLIHHPWAYRPLYPRLWTLGQKVPQFSFRWFEGRGAGEVLQLPKPWPPEDD